MASQGRERSPARDEQVLASEAWDEQVLVTPGWTEHAYVGSHYVFHADGYPAYSMEDVYAHTEYLFYNDDGSMNFDAITSYYAVDDYADVWHEPVYETVRHDAVYQTVHHDAVYQTVHHDAEGWWG